MLKLRIMVRDENFIINNAIIESQTKHLQLPCTVQEEGCQTSSKTYIWKNTAGDCNLHRVRTIAPNRTKGTWLIDQCNQLRLNVTGVYPVPGWELVLKTRQLDNVFLAELAKAETRNKIYRMPQIAIRKIDMQRNPAVALQ